MARKVKSVFRLLVLPIIPTVVYGFNLTKAVEDAAILPPDHGFFMKNRPGWNPPYQNGLFVTLPGCEALAGRGWSPYNAMEAGMAITTWFIPLFVLAGNLYIPHIGSICVNIGNFLAVMVHVFGDPIDSVNSLLWKLDQGRHAVHLIRSELGINPQPPFYQRWWRRLRRHPSNTSDELDLTVRNLAVVLYALDDFSNALETRIDRLVAMYSDPQHRNALLHTARTLMDIRVNNSRRSYLAIIAYVATLITAWMRTRSDPPLHTPHTVALRQLYYWLLPAIVLSSATGGFPSTDTARWELMGLNYHSNQMMLPDGEEDLEEVRVTNANYTILHPKRARWTKRRVVLFAMSVGIVTTATASALAMTTITPTVGIGCRGLTQLGYWGAWIISTGITWGLRVCWNRRQERRGKFPVELGDEHSRWERDWWWIIMIVKDTIITGNTLFWLLYAFRGLWNSCECWAAVWPLGRENAFIDLRLEDRITDLANTTYPYVVLGALGAQTLWILLAFGMSRDALTSEFHDGENRELGYSYTTIPQAIARKSDESIYSEENGSSTRSGQTSPNLGGSSCGEECWGPGAPEDDLLNPANLRGEHEEGFQLQLLQSHAPEAVRFLRLEH